MTVQDMFLILTVVDCGTLTDPANGQVSHTTGTTFGLTATYSCNPGYKLVGDINCTCQATGVWSGSEPTCQCMLLHCPTCVHVHNGSSISCCLSSRGLNSLDMCICARTTHLTIVHCVDTNVSLNNDSYSVSWTPSMKKTVD